MPNHIHLVAKPADANGLAQLLRRAHSEYAQWFNKQAGRIGHLWQNRYFSCALERAHVYNALRYVDMNPVRSNLVANACDWRWSSARAHCDGGRDEFGLTAIEEMATWRDLPDWAALLGAIDSEADQRVRTHTRQGHPIGSRGFLKALEGASQRRLSPRPSGRPPGRVGRNTYEAA
jgi:putative transposase